MIWFLILVNRHWPITNSEQNQFYSFFFLNTPLHHCCSSWFGLSTHISVFWISIKDAFFLSRHLMVSITEMIWKSHYRRLSFIFRCLCHQGWIGNTKYFMMECDRVMVKVGQKQSEPMAARQSCTQTEGESIPEWSELRWWNLISDTHRHTHTHKEAE